MKYMKKFFEGLKHNFIYVIIFAIFVAIDQISKFYFDGKEIEIIEGVFSFRSSHNDGAGLSFLSGKVWLLILISGLFLVAMIVFNHYYKNKTKLYKTSFAFLFAGAMGNLVDRVIFRYVRDFISFDLINFPIFNFADTCLTIGVVLLLIYFIFFESRQKKNGTKNVDKKQNSNQSIRQNKKSDKALEDDEEKLTLTQDEINQLASKNQETSINETNKTISQNKEQE